MEISTKYIYYNDRWKKYIVEKQTTEGKKVYGRFKTMEEAFECRDKAFGTLEKTESLENKDGRYRVEKLNKYLAAKDGKYKVVKAGKSYGTFTLTEARKQRNKLFGRQFKDFGSTNFEKRTIHLHKHTAGYSYYNKLVAEQFRGWY